MTASRYADFEEIISLMELSKRYADELRPQRNDMIVELVEGGLPVTRVAKMARISRVQAHNILNQHRHQIKKNR